MAIAIDENQLVVDIYKAAYRPTHWRKVFVDIKNAVGADECTIFFYDAQCRSRNYADSSFGDEGIIQCFLDRYIDLEVALLNEKFLGVPEGFVMEMPKIVALSSDSFENHFEQSYRDELMRKTLQVRAGMVIIHGKIIASAMGIKSFPDSPPLKSGAIEFLHRLSPHIVQAIHIHNHITSLNSTVDCLKSALDCSKHGVFLLGEKGQVLFANAAASHLLVERNTGLRLTKGGVLSHVSESQNAVLALAIDAAINGARSTESFCQTLAIQLLNAPIPLHLQIVSMRHPLADEFTASHASAIVFTRNPNDIPDVPAYYLQMAYGLTQAEAAIAQQLLVQPDVAAVSILRGTTIETIRGQLKQIMRKTATQSQGELVALLGSLASEL